MAKNFDGEKRLPTVFGENAFKAEPIHDPDAFVEKASMLFQKDLLLSEIFSEQLRREMEKKQRTNWGDTFALKPLTSFANAGIAQVFANLTYAFHQEGYTYEMFYETLPPITPEDMALLQEMSEVQPVVQESRTLFGRIRLPQKIERDKRIVYGTNATEDIVLVETTATIPWNEGSREKLAWIHRYSAYRRTAEGIHSLGKPLTIASFQYDDVDFLINDLDLNAVVSPDQLREHISFPKGWLLTK